MRRVAAANGHACPIRWKDRDFLLWCSNDRTENWRNALELISIDDPSDVRVLFDCGKKHYAMSISAGPNAAYMALYDPTLGLPNQIFEVPYDGSPFTLLHEWQPVYYRGYDSQPRATYSDGLLCFNVDDGTETSVFGLQLAASSVPELPNPERWSGTIEILDGRIVRVMEKA